MIPRRVRLAVLIAFACHGLFILSGRYRMSYDAYTHMLFANHYAENWFSLWETRWYAGFPVISYPPLTHQLIAIFIPFLGFDKAFALILWIVTALYPLGVYAFSRSFTGKTSASYAALASAVLLPIYVTAHIFGQLPFLTSTLTALFAAASLNRYLREGGLHNFALTSALITTSMAMHHATLMVQPFLIFAVAINNLLRKTYSFLYTALLLRRLILFGVVSVITSLIVIFPFWQWGTVQALQTPIDHLSRHNFFTDPIALSIFFFPLYGPFVVLIPYLISRWPARFIGLLISFTFLFLFGLGGTTPLPQIFLGKAWEWLTYDRFAFWACLILTPFFGIFFIRLKRKWRNLLSARPIQTPLRRTFIPSIVFFMLTFTALGAWFTPIVFPFEPEVIDMEPIEKFLNDGTNSQWRYLTFGFGDQFAYLNLLTRATTIDGSYHTARTFPELRDSSIGQVDTAYWAVNGMTAIKPVLLKSGEYSVRWGFVNPGTREPVRTHWGVIYRSPFIPVLEDLGWKKIKTLANGIFVYENPNALPLVDSTAPDFPPLTSFAWGVFPMLAFIAASALGASRLYPLQAEWIMRKMYAFAIGLLPLTLCFWAYRTIGDFSHPRVYFTYDNALFFMSDAVVAFAVLLWLTVKIAQGSNIMNGRFQGIRLILIFLFVFVLLITASIVWSHDWRTSLYLSLHFWLILFLIISLADWSEVWQVAMFGLCCALCIELIAGFTEFGLQSTAFLRPLELEWPGNLTPSIVGVSVVQLTSGLRILRAYGTMPHPNILGGLVLITLLGPASLFLMGGKSNNYPALLLLALGIPLLVLSFSRSAWLGYIAFILILILKHKYFERKKLILFISTTTIAVVCILFPLRELIFSRVSNQNISTEQISTVGRFWQDQQAIGMIKKSPIIGVGIGSFILELSKTAIAGAPIEPVHNLPLLVTAELGIAGIILILSICALVARRVIRSKSSQAILAGAMLAGLGMIGVFDHYLWTLAPGRIMLGLVLGLWAGQAANHA
jgi:O-antigen ligase